MSFTILSNAEVAIGDIGFEVVQLKEVKVCLIRPTCINGIRTQKIDGC